MEQRKKKGTQKGLENQEGLTKWESNLKSVKSYKLDGIPTKIT